VEDREVRENREEVVVDSGPETTLSVITVK